MKSSKENLFSHDYLINSLHYNPENGVFTWKIRPDCKGNFNSFLVGKKTGYLGKNGYLQIRIKGSLFLAHRLAFFYIYKRWPLIIDHINHNRSDNRIDNLREVTSADNNKNQSLFSHNTSGFTGVSYKSGIKKWIAYINVNYKRIVLGNFDTKEKAIEARKKANTEYNFNQNMTF